MRDRLHHAVEADRALAARADVAARVDIAVRVAPEVQLSRVAGGARRSAAARQCEPPPSLPSRPAAYQDDEPSLSLRRS
jgi:hypothetical protein